MFKKKKCASCGKKFSREITGSICPDCSHRKEEEMKDATTFRTTAYTPEDIANHRFSADSIRLVMGGYVTAALVFGFAFVGAKLGLLFGSTSGGGIIQGDALAGAGLGGGALLGFAIANTMWRRWRPQRCEVVSRRRVETLILGMFFGMLPGLFAGIGLTLQLFGPEAAATLHGGLLTVVVGSFVTMLCGIIYTYAQDAKNKREALASLGKWCKSRPGQTNQ
jgi:hypothetical protein